MNLGDIHATSLHHVPERFEEEEGTVHIAPHPRLRLPHTSVKQMAERH